MNLQFTFTFELIERKISKWSFAFPYLETKWCEAVAVLPPSTIAIDEDPSSCSRSKMKITSAYSVRHTHTFFVLVVCRLEFQFSSAISIRSSVNILIFSPFRCSFGWITIELALVHEFGQINTFRMKWAKQPKEKKKELQWKQKWRRMQSKWSSSFVVSLFSHTLRLCIYVVQWTCRILYSWKRWYNRYGDRPIPFVFLFVWMFTGKWSRCLYFCLICCRPHRYSIFVFIWICVPISLSVSVLASFFARSNWIWVICSHVV